MSPNADRQPARLTVDYGDGLAEVELASGLVLTRPLSRRAAKHSGEICRTDYDPENREQTITFAWGETAIVEVGPVEHPNAPVVYLDQNHWIMLARQQWAPEKVPAPNRDGYERLLALARERAMVLPLSAAHAFETARRDGHQRRELATTMLQLSRGWQMRSPLKVRREELVSAAVDFRSNSTRFPNRPVFTLDPDALFSSSDYAVQASPAADLHARLSWAPAFAETLIEDEREDDTDARAKAERWATIHAAIGNRMAEANASAEEKWATARMALLSDLTDELASAAAMARFDNREWEEWLLSSETSFDAMPAIGRVQAVTYQRLCDPRYPWHHRDLSDMHFLSCAAGYADFLLAEKATSHDLRRSEHRVAAGAQVCSSVGELVDLL